MQGYFYNKQSVEEDQTLWSAIIQGDKAALGHLFDVYVKELLSYGYRITKDIDQVKDAVQDVFVDIWTYRGTLNKDVQVKFYLYRCLRNALLKQLENQSHAPFDDREVDEVADPDSCPETRWMMAESELGKHSDLVRSLDLLSQREKEIISLKYYSGMKLREIAELLGLKEQTISNTLQNALVKLRKHLVYVLLVVFALV